MLAAQRLGFVDGGKSGPIQPSGMKTVKIDSQLHRMPLDNGGVSEVLTRNKVGRKARSETGRICRVDAVGPTRQRLRRAVCWEGAEAN
jgi:hypothetical protein